jgi:hypothetical protein
VIVDDDFSNAEKVGLPIVSEAHNTMLGAAYTD